MKIPSQISVWMCLESYEGKVEIEMETEIHSTPKHWCSNRSREKTRKTEMCRVRECGKPTKSE